MQETAGALETVECDYLVVGAGPRCMAFTDVLLNRMDKAAVKRPPPRIVIVDDKDQPGGHWNTTPRFFRLQEDSRRYGVTSRRLERTDRRHVAGNRQLPQHASVTEVLAYYSTVMEGFLASSLVKYFPKSYFTGSIVRSVVDPDNAFKVSVERRLVHSTPVRFSAAPSHKPRFKVRGGALVVSPSDLSSHSWPAPRFVVIGSGKVGINVVLWLLLLGVDPSKIHWVMPREALLMSSEAMDGPSGAQTTVDGAKSIMKAAALRDSLQDFLEAGHLCHIHEDVPPESFHLASVTWEELQQLRRIKQVIRLGHVVCVHPDRMALEQGQYHTGQGTLHIDCTSSWIKDQPHPEDVFQSGRIVLQPVAEMVTGGGCLSTCMSAALIGVIECLGMDDNCRNTLITGTRLPDTFADWYHTNRIANGNPDVWHHPELQNFLWRGRLNLLFHTDISPLLWFSIPKKLAIAQKAELILAQHFQEQAEKRFNKRLAPLMLPISKANLSMMDLGSEDGDSSVSSTLACSPREAAGSSD